MRSALELKEDGRAIVIVARKKKILVVLYYEEHTCAEVNQFLLGQSHVSAFKLRINVPAFVIVF